MPYITPENRASLRGREPETPGELAYEIWRLVREYEERTNASRYPALIQVYGVLTGLAAEYYRRVLVPYEDDKRKHNGDV